MYIWSIIIFILITFFIIPNIKYQRKNTNPKLILLRQFVDDFTNYLKNKYCGFDNDLSDKILKFVEIMKSNRLFENTFVLSASKTSYTKDKGKYIKICLDSDINTLKHVLLHEMAHVMNDNYGHTNEFWKTMNFLSTEANNAGLFTIINYKESPVKYCGMIIDYNPLFDKKYY